MNRVRSIRPSSCSARSSWFCVRDDLMPDRLLPGRQVPVIFRIARDCEADHTAAGVGKRHAADHCMLVCFSAPTRRLTARLHAKETTSMTIDVATAPTAIDGIRPESQVRTGLPAG